MGYVKINKPGIASGVPQFDLLLAENVATIRLATGLIEVNYVGDLTNNITITPVGYVAGTTSTHFTQVDTQVIENAVGLIGGGSGMIDTGMLSKSVNTVVYAAA